MLTLAEIFEDAIALLNEQHWSCNAVCKAIEAKLGLGFKFENEHELPEASKKAGLWDQYWVWKNKAFKYLEAMGCDTFSGNGFEEFEHGFRPTKESQTARAIWLTWAAMMAEEEGV